MRDVLHRQFGLRESSALIDSEDERPFSVLVIHVNFKALGFDLQHSDLNFMKDMLLYHEKLQLENHNK